MGRAEPFAKVFQSSRLVKQAVGLTAWGILEDIALDATLDTEGRLVAETSARRIADNLGLNKETVSRHLGRLREYGFVLHEEVRDRGSGRYESARYVLDPSARIERFTSTPRRQVHHPAPRTDNPSTAHPASGKPGHGGSVHKKQNTVPQEQNAVASKQQTGLHAAAPLELGVDSDAASALAARYSPGRVREVSEVARRQASRNPAGWAIRALEGGWTVTGSHRANPEPYRSEQSPARMTDEGARSR